MSRAAFTALAEADLEDIGDYIAQDNPSRALSFVAELRGQCDKIALAPLTYPARPELAENLRSCAPCHFLSASRQGCADRPYTAWRPRH